MGLRSYLEWRLWADDEAIRRAKKDMGEDRYYAEQARELAGALYLIAGFFALLFLAGPILGAARLSIPDPWGAIVLFGYLLGGFGAWASISYVRVGRMIRSYGRIIAQERNHGVI